MLLYYNTSLSAISNRNTYYNMLMTSLHSFTLQVLNDNFEIISTAKSPDRIAWYITI